MPRPKLEIADIFRRYGPAWRQANAGHVSLSQLKVMSASETCRTEALGGVHAHKKLVRAALSEPRDEVVAKGQAHRQITLNSRDFREGMAAFLEKRPAQFEGH